LGSWSPSSCDTARGPEDQEQTTTPTMSAATEDHVHNTRIFSACLVTRWASRNAASSRRRPDEQADRVRAAKPTSALSERRESIACAAPQNHPSTPQIRDRFGAYWTARSGRSGCHDTTSVRNGLATRREGDHSRPSHERDERSCEEPAGRSCGRAPAKARIRDWPPKRSVGRARIDPAG